MHRNHNVVHFATALLVGLHTLSIALPHDVQANDQPVETLINCSVEEWNGGLCLKQTSSTNFIPPACNNAATREKFAIALQNKLAGTNRRFLNLLTDFTQTSGLRDVHTEGTLKQTLSFNWYFRANAQTTVIIVNFSDSPAMLGSTFYPRGPNGCGVPSDQAANLENEDLSYFIIQRAKEVAPQLCQQILDR